MNRRLHRRLDLAIVLATLGMIVSCAYAALESPMPERTGPGYPGPVCIGESTAKSCPD